MNHLSSTHDASVTSTSMLRKDQVCSMLGVSSRTLEGLTSSSQFPRGVQLGRHKYWSHSVVEKWLQRKFDAQEKWQPRGAR